MNLSGICSRVHAKLWLRNLSIETTFIKLLQAPLTRVKIIFNIKIAMRRQSLYEVLQTHNALGAQAIAERL